MVNSVKAECSYFGTMDNVSGRNQGVKKQMIVISPTFRAANAGIDEFVSTKANEKIKNLKADSKPKSNTGKKIGVSLASILYSGLGQAVNGQWGKALGFCLGESAAALAGFCIAGPIGAIIGAYAVKGLSIYDAVKNV